MSRHATFKIRRWIRYSYPEQVQCSVPKAEAQRHEVYEMGRKLGKKKVKWAATLKETTQQEPPEVSTPADVAKINFSAKFMLPQTSEGPAKLYDMIGEKLRKGSTTSWERYQHGAVITTNTTKKNISWDHCWGKEASSKRLVLKRI